MALLALGFTAKSSIHPSVPMVLFGVFFGFGYVLVFLAMILYLSFRTHTLYKRYLCCFNNSVPRSRRYAVCCIDFVSTSRH
jgi:hypothetical protein